MSFSRRKIPDWTEDENHVKSHATVKKAWIHDKNPVRATVEKIWVNKKDSENGWETAYKGYRQPIRLQQQMEPVTVALKSESECVEATVEWMKSVEEGENQQ